jgi:hypothetical protein
MNSRAVSLLILLASGSFAPAAEPLKTYTDPTDVDADFAVQGEYTGMLDLIVGGDEVGCQVVALGGGKFRAVMYMGGLPGAGWDKDMKYEGTGQTTDSVTLFENPLGSGRIVGQEMTLLAPLDVKVGVLRRIERKSPTLGAKPPEGAIVLFDGTSAEQFTGGRMTPDGLLMGGTSSKQLFGDCKLHLEFRTPYMPDARGQGRGNSGCYLQGRYETQILDSFGTEGKDNECGALYSTRAPDVNMCFPPLSWQTYDLDFKAARYDASGKKTKNATITVRHNGEIVQRNAEFPAATRAAPLKEGPEKGPIHLQDHGNPVRYRNIWVVEGEEAVKTER